MSEQQADPRTPVPGTRDDDRERLEFEAWKAAQRDAQPAAQDDTNTDSTLRGPKHEAQFAPPVEKEYGEGVKTGPPYDSYVWLADGSVIEGHAGGTHYHDAERGLIPIVRTYPKGVVENA